ncbi:hypothetical protein CK203_004237 [Vitis vinifera]|uniref:Uncharacterized protein n=1 Tax=Vitis vinifera TaxID=29760 RepID=A0A438KAB4_VITVI|nr:hypothetical protein CK203_004237 [Vitis vinifera]
MANARARRNFLSKIKVNGVNLSSLADIKEGVCSAYQTLLSDPEDWRPSINGLNFKELGKGLASNLEVMEFYLLGTFQRSLKSTFLLLIPKKEGTEDLKDFRPISLHAFVHGRQILDVVLIANEALDSRLKDNIPSLLLKMDIEKDFDHVNWNFLMEVMSKMGFGHRWINWIKMVLLHSFLLDPHQWKPLGLLSARGRESEGLFMSHLLFAGLKVNLSKTKAIQVGEGIPMETLVSVLGCKIGSLPTSYLGIPLGAPYKSTRVWDAVEERFRKRLEKIQRDFLWGGGALENKPHLHIIFSKYDLQKGGWCSKGVRNRYGVGVWKAIRKGWEKFHSHSRFIIGDGTRVKFWKDLWCGNQSLEEAFPILFNLSVNKEGWVVEAWKEDEGGGGKRTRMEPFMSSLFIAHSQGTPNPPSRLELFGRLGFQLGLASLVRRRLGAGCSPQTA